MTKEKSCGGIIYKQENEVYKFLRIKPILGHWGFSKCHVEDGETEVETAIREIKEETGFWMSSLILILGEWPAITPKKMF